MRQLLIATKNPGKIKEIKKILGDIPFELKTLEDVNLEEEILESGRNYRENAVIKAKTIGEKTKILTLAEDSGLEVDVLGGRPGVFSARFAEGSDLDRINKLLKELEGIPKEKRNARFKAMVAVYIPSSHPEELQRRRIPYVFRIQQGILRPDQIGAQNDNSPRIVTFEGVSEGYITEEPIGSNGFGYDPIFFNFDLGKTNAEATLEGKNKVSHRGRALQKVKIFLLRLSK